MEKEESSKIYELLLNNNPCLLSIKQEQNKNINFQLRLNDSVTFYSKEFNFEDLLKQLLLSKDIYDKISTIFIFFENEISKNNITLTSNEKSVKLSLKKIVDSKETECSLVLDETKLSNEEMINILYKDIIEIKLKSINEEKKLAKKNQDLEKK